MKTLHLSIIGIVGIIVISMATLGVFLEKLNDNPYTTVNTNDGQKPGSLSEKNCGQFYVIPEKQHDLYTVPVLLMGSNSTSCAKITFTVVDTHNADPTYRLAVLRQELDFQIGNYNVTTNGHSFSISHGKDHANSFEIFYMSQTVDSYPANYRIGDDPVNYPAGTNFTETIFIKALPNATGFYDYSIPGPNCSHYPLAVGYAENQVNASDFSKVNPLGQTCKRSPYEIASVQISGMSYKELQLEPIQFEVAK